MKCAFIGRNKKNNRFCSIALWSTTLFFVNNRIFLKSLFSCCFLYIFRYTLRNNTKWNNRIIYIFWSIKYSKKLKLIKRDFNNSRVSLYIILIPNKILHFRVNNINTNCYNYIINIIYDSIRSIEYVKYIYVFMCFLLFNNILLIINFLLYQQNKRGMNSALHFKCIVVAKSVR